MSAASSTPVFPRTKASFPALFFGPHCRSNADGIGYQTGPSNWYGAIAQLGERLHGMQEVSGSIPLGSTNFRPSRAVNFLKNWCGRKLVEPSALACAALACGQGGLGGLATAT